MKKILASLAVAGLALSTGAAIAQDAAALPEASTFTGVDTDQNGTVSWAEFSLVFPDVNETQFNSADVDGDGLLSEDEYATLAISTGSVGGGDASDGDTTGPGNLNQSLTDTTTE